MTPTEPAGVSDYAQLQAENARLREARRMIHTPLADAEYLLVYREEDGDPVPSATYVQVALVHLLSEEREALRLAEAQIRVALAECRRALNERPVADDLVSVVRQALRQQSPPERP